MNWLLLFLIVATLQCLAIGIGFAIGWYILAPLTERWSRRNEP